MSQGEFVRYQRMPLDVVVADAVQVASYLELEPVPLSARRARQFVREHAPGLAADVEDCLLLLTSELVSNAVIHARTALELGVALTDSSVVVTVFDLDLALPVQEPYADREGGWGLGLVAALARSWSSFRHPEGGKTMWFCLSRAPDGEVAADGSAARSGTGSTDPGTVQEREVAGR